MSIISKERVTCNGFSSAEKNYVIEAKIKDSKLVYADHKTKRNIVRLFVKYCGVK